jgi:hypothetical protein
MTTLAETKRRIAVMQAWVDGKKIQYSAGGSFDWQACTNPVWGWGKFDYRIAPEKQAVVVVKFKRYKDTYAAFPEEQWNMTTPDYKNQFQVVQRIEVDCE